MEKLLTILNSFARDDFNHLYNALQFKNYPLLLLIPSNIGPIFYRPVSQQLYFLANFYLFDLNPIYYHFANIFFHILTGLVLYILIRKITNSGIAFYSSVFWVLNPINLFSVLWICGFSMVGGVLFMLLAITLFVYEKKILSLFTLILALCSNEISIFILPVLFFYSFYIKNYSLSLSIKKIAIYLYIIALYLGFFYGLKRNPMGEYSSTIDILSNIKIFLKYYLYPFITGFERGGIFKTFNIFLIGRFLLVNLLFLVSIVQLIKMKNLNKILFFWLWFFIPTLFLSLIPSHAFAYMGTFSAIGLICIYTFTIYKSFKLFLDFKFIKILYVFIQIFILIIAFNNDADVNWLYKYSKGSNYYKNTIKTSYNLSSMDKQEIEYTFYGKMYGVYKLSKLQN